MAAEPGGVGEPERHVEHVVLVVLRADVVRYCGRECEKGEATNLGLGDLVVALRVEDDVTCRARDGALACACVRAWG